MTRFPDMGCGSFCVYLAYPCQTMIIDLAGVIFILCERVSNAHRYTSYHFITQAFCKKMVKDVREVEFACLSMWYMVALD